MVENNRISLSDNLQRKWFEEAMATLADNKDELFAYELSLFTNMRDGYATFGTAMTVSRKQMEQIRQIAWDFEKGR